MRPARALLLLLAALLGAGAALALARLLLPPQQALVAQLQLGWYLALALLALVAAVDALVQGPACSITVQRHAPSSVALDNAVRVELALRHASRSTLRVCVTEHTDARLECEGLPHELQLAPGGTTTLGYQLLPRVRGDASLGPVELRARSPWGLWEFRLRPLAATPVRVFPDFAPLVRLAGLSIEQQVLRIGVHLQARRGEGTDFQELREFRAGDTLRQVDWKATARHRRPISRQYRDERDQDLVFALDCGRRMRAHDERISHFDSALNALLLTAHVALREGDAVGLLSFAGEERWIAPRKGRAGIDALLGGLYDLHSSTATSDYLEVAEQLMSRHRKRALIVLLSNLRDEDVADLRAATRLLARRHRVLVASVRERVLDASVERPIESFEQALLYGSALHHMAARTRLVRALRGAGVAVVDTPAATLHTALVREYLTLKRTQRL